MGSPRFSTFSIVAYDADGPAWGIAVASKFPAVGAVVPWAAAGAGAVATQSFANTAFGPHGLELMASGLSAEETLKRLLVDDPERQTRQVGLVDRKGESATFTGGECLPWAGGQTGEGLAVQGNILTGPETVEAMVATYRHSTADLPQRLLEALLAGDRAGGDRRGRQSAAILVVKPKAGYGGMNDRWMDYRVDDDPDPVPRLAMLVDLHRLYFGKSSPEDQLPIAGEVAEALQLMMQRLDYYQGPIDGSYSDATREALRAFLGNENFEDRTDFSAGRIDRPVFDHLRLKFGD